MKVADQYIKLVEWSEEDHYFHEKYGLNGAQVVKNTNIERMVDGIQLRRAASFLKELAI